MRLLLLTLLVTLAGSVRPDLRAGAPEQAADTPVPALRQTEHIQAERFLFTPSEVRTTLGTTLVLELKSDDTDHGFHIVGTDINVSIPKRGRGTIAVTFTPEEAGRYTFECSHVCGAGHDFMRGTIVVSAASGEVR